MKRILIADDSTFMRIIMKKFLTKHGYDVIGEAENGRIAVEKYIELAPDAITLDITMDEMSGIEALKKIVEYDKNAIAVMVSAMGQESFVKEAISSGAKGFLIKPLNEEKVIDAMSKLLK